MSISIRILILLAFAATGCRQGGSSLSKENIDEKVAARAATGRGIEVPDFFSSSRTNVQTKGVVTFTLNSSAAGDAYELTLEALSTNQVLFENQKIMLGLTDFQEVELGSGFTLGDNSDITIRIYPSVAETARKLQYGENKMRLTATGSSGKKYGENAFTLTDFAYFGPIYSTPVPLSNVAHLEGGLNGLANGISSNGKGFLFTNPVHILTH